MNSQDNTPAENEVSRALIRPSKDAKGLSLHVRTDVSAEGTVSAGRDGAPQFVGKINVTKTNTIEFPEGLREAEEVASFLQKTLHIGSLLDKTGAATAVANAVSPGGQLAAPATTPTPATPGECRLTFDIFGMHCASCAGLIERKVRKVPGVKEVNVNFGAEKARVIFERALADA
jgi:hypothetical protein